MSTKNKNVTNPLDGTVVVGVGDLAEMYGRTWHWSRQLLRQWWEEQEKGGSIKVFRKGKQLLYTTIAVLQREMPPARDMALVRQVHNIDLDVDRLARRVNKLTEEVELMRKKKIG